jgi:hypothetical protein
MKNDVMTVTNVKVSGENWHRKIGAFSPKYVKYSLTALPHPIFLSDPPRHFPIFIDPTPSPPPPLPVASPTPL